MSEHDSIVTGAPAARSDDDVADALYGDPAIVGKTYELSMQDSVNRMTDHLGWSEQQRTEHVQAVALAFQDARIPPGPAGTLHSLISQYSTEPADDATMKGWAVETRRALREQYGITEGDRRLEVARQFVSRRPELARLLNETGVGSHPEFVKSLVESPHSMRLAPRPRTPKKG